MGQRSGGPRQRRTSSATRNTPPTKPSTTCTTGRSGRSALLRGRQLQGVRRGAAPAAARRLRRGPASGRCRAGLAAELRRHGHGHQAGTARFETDPSASVLDVQCKADDLDNLYVADGSFMPSIGAVNPTLTIIANALRVGDHVAERIGPTRHPQRPTQSLPTPRGSLAMPKIEDYALLGDLHTAALVSAAGQSTGCACPVSTPRPRSPRSCTMRRRDIGLSGLRGRATARPGGTLVTPWCSRRIE